MNVKTIGIMDLHCEIRFFFLRIWESYFLGGMRTKLTPTIVIIILDPMRPCQICYHRYFFFQFSLSLFLTASDLLGPTAILLFNTTPAHTWPGALIIISTLWMFLVDKSPFCGSTLHDTMQVMTRHDMIWKDKTRHKIEVKMWHKVTIQDMKGHDMKGQDKT